MSLDSLQEVLKAVPAATVTDSNLSAKLIAQLASCRGSLDGPNAENMEASKLKQAEQIAREPPMLSFYIKGHADTTMGSVYAGLTKTAKWMVLRNSRGDEGPPRNRYCSFTVP